MKLKHIDKGYIHVHGPEVVISMIYKNNYHVPKMNTTKFFHNLRNDIRFGVLKRRVIM